MLMLSFPEIFATPEFIKYFQVTNFDSGKALTWICDSTLPQAQLAVTHVTNKANGRSKELEGPNIHSETDNCFVQAWDRTSFEAVSRRACYSHVHTF